METERADKLIRYEFPGVRYLFTAAGFFGFFTIFAVRVNLSIAIVSMVNETSYITSNITNDECKILSSNSSGLDLSEVGEFNWSPEVQAAILGSFYYGYCITQIPGGRLAEIFNGKWVFGIGTFISVLLTLITPLAARYSAGALIAIRAIEGLAQGVTVPAMHSMIGHWLPETEKAFLSTIIYCGMSIGTVVGMFVTGILCGSDFLGGWPAAFYVTGIFGVIWFFIWCLLVTETPLSHPFISNKELDYITSHQIIAQKKELSYIPWRKILTSLPFWALVIMQTGGDWSFYTVVNDISIYFRTILHFDVEKNGFLSSYPRLFETILGLIVGLIADYVIRKEKVKKSVVRKFCSVVSGIGSALAYVGVYFSGCDVTMNITFLMLTNVFGGFYYSGYNLTLLDMSPEYAGTLMGITNTVSSLTGFLAPLLVGLITQEQAGLREWRIIFGVVIVILIVSSLFFLLFSSSDKQDWESTEEKKCLINSDALKVSICPPADTSD